MLFAIDRLCGAWFNWRASQQAKALMEAESAVLKDVKQLENGYEAILAHSGVALIADEFAGLLADVGAENYFTFTMLPRADRTRGKMVEVTIRWADKKSPSQVSDERYAEIQRLRALIEASGDSAVFIPQIMRKGEWVDDTYPRVTLALAMEYVAEIEELACAEWQPKMQIVKETTRREVVNAGA